MDVFPQRLKEIREMRGYSRQQLADLLGITYRAYQYYESGKNQPPLDKLIALCHQLMVSSDYLLGLSDKK